MKIRAYQTEDEEAVIDLWRRCGLLTPHNNPRTDIQRKLAVNPELFLVGVVESEIMATVMAGYEGHRGWINYLAVAPHFQKTGCGRAMMARAEGLLRERGCPKINLQVRSSNRAVMAFYEWIGFEADDVVSMGKRLVTDEPYESGTPQTKPIRHAPLPCLLLLLLSYEAWLVPGIPADSGVNSFLYCVLLVAPVCLLAALLAARPFLILMRSRGRKWGLVWIGAMLMVPPGVFFLSWRRMNPAGIAYDFGYGQSGSWHEVQLRHLQDGRWIEGPWVGGWPLKVRFPDLNGDGHADIRVTGDRGRVTEFVFLPDNDGKRFWHLTRNEGYCISYPPDGVYYP